MFPVKQNMFPTVGTHWNLLAETVLLSTHKTCFSAKITKLILALVMLNPNISYFFSKSVEPTDLDLHCLPFSM